MTLGIVIVTHNSSTCIASCLNAAGPHGSVIVVDNASADNTVSIVKSFPSVSLIPNTINKGFAAATNQAIAQLNTDCILLLNPDAILQTSVAPLIQACTAPGYAAAGGLLLDPTGQPQKGFMIRRFPTAATLAFEALGLNSIWPSNPINKRYRYADHDPNQPCDTEQPAGAFLMFRRDTWVAFKGFDERFHPLWFEDVDFLQRIQSAGHKIRYQPAAIAIHQGAHSITQLEDSKRVFYWYDNLLMYAAKHFSIVAFRAVALAVFCGAAVRLCRRSSSAKGYAKVMRLAAKAVIYGS